MEIFISMIRETELTLLFMNGSGLGAFLLAFIAIAAIKNPKLKANDLFVSMIAIASRKRQAATKNIDE